MKNSEEKKQDVLKKLSNQLELLTKDEKKGTNELNNNKKQINEKEDAEVLDLLDLKGESKLENEVIDVFDFNNSVINEHVFINNDLKNKYIKDLDLSVRSKNGLMKNKIFMLSDLLLCSEREIRNFRNLGSKSCDEIIQKLKELGLKLFTDNYNEYLDCKIENLHFSTRTVNCLTRANILTLYDLLSTSLEEIEEIPYLGEGCLREIKQKIHNINFNERKRKLDSDDILVSDLGLSVRSTNCLEKVDIFTVNQLSKLSLNELIEIQNLGRKSYEEVVAKMKELNKPLKNKDLSLEVDNIDYPDINYNFIKSIRLIEDVFGNNVMRNFDEMRNQEFLKRLNNSLDTLKQPAKDILIARYGLITGENMTLQEVANIQNVTRERIRQSVERSLEKLRSKKHSKILRTYFTFEGNSKEKDMNDIEFVMSLLE